MPELAEVIQQQRADVGASNGEPDFGTPAPSGKPDASAIGNDDQNAANSEAQNDDTPVEGGGEDNDAQADANLRRGRNHYARRIDKLTREASELRETNAALTRVVERALGGAQGQPAAQPAQQPQGNDVGPQREQFASYEDYIEARADWKAERRATQAQHALLTQLARAAQAQQAQQQGSQLAGQFQSRLAEGRKEFSDWDATFDGDAADLPVSQAATAAIVHSENPAAVMYWLGKNPDALRKLNSMPLVQAAIEVGRIAESSSKGRGTPNLSRAPKPGNPANVRGGTPGGYRDDMPMDEFVAMRSKRR